VFDKLLQPEAIFLLKLHKKAFSYQAPPGPIRGVFTAPPDLPVRLRGCFGQGSKGGQGRDKMRREEGSSPYHQFLDPPLPAT